MCWTVSVLITWFVLIVCTVCQKEVKFMGDLNKFFDFDHNIFLLDSSVDINQFINAGRDFEFTPKTLYVSNDKIDDNNNNKRTELWYPIELNSKNAVVIIVPAKSNFENYLQLLNRLKELQGPRITMKIGFVLTHYSPNETESYIAKLFQWCKKELVIDVFAVTYGQPEVGLAPNHTERSLKIFSFDPFISFDMTDVTKSPSLNSVFRSVASNFQQYQLILSEPWDDGDEFWPTLLNHMNATYTILKHNFTKQSEYFESGLHIIPGIRSQIGLREEYNLYPCDWRRFTVLVPASLPYSDFSAYLRNITSNALLGIVITTIVTCTVFLSIARYIKQKRFLIFESFADVMNLVFNDNGYIKYQRLYHLEGFIIVPLTFAGFFIVNLVLSILLVHLTRPVDQPQINSPLELYSSPYTVRVSTQRPKSLAALILQEISRETMKLNWTDKLNISKEKVDDDMKRFDRSASYILTTIDVKRMLNIQKRLNIKAYHDSNINVTGYGHGGYLVNKNFLFFERLNELYHRVRSVGLYDEWRRRVDFKVETMILEGYRKHKRESDENIESNIEFPTFIVYGWIVGGIVLIIEILWKRLKHK